MRKFEGYEKTEAFTGDYEQLEPGGYICKILKVITEEKPYGELLRIGFDVIEGEHKDFYKRKFEKAKLSNSEAKWQGMYYQTVKQDDLKYFKGFITAVENSNSGYKWDWDEKKLVGKLFGGVFGQEEFENNKGKIKLSTKCVWVRSVDQVRKGIEPPEIKRLAGRSAPTSGWDPVSTNAESDDDLPF